MRAGFFMHTFNFQWDDEKRRANADKHGVDFPLIAEFDWQTAVVIEDRRRNYGERRYSATGLIGSRLHVVVFTPRGDGLRLISLRRANRRDERKWQDTRP